jgi:hypothetical protein
VDDTFGRPGLARVRQTTRRADWAALPDAVAAAVADGDDRSTAIAVATRTITMKGQPLRLRLERWVADEPHNATAVLLLGAVEVERAWEARGLALAAQTAPNRLRAFGEILQRAELLCRAAADLDPADPTPWEWLLRMARGQQVEVTETLSRRQRLAALSPHHFMGHYTAVCSLSPMWGYPVETMFEQAEGWAAEAPAGSVLPALTFVAHFEWWRRGHLDERRFLRDPRIRAAAEDATSRMPMTPCQRRDEFWAHNHAAGWYSLIHDWRRAAQHLQLLGGYRTAAPWEYLTWRAPHLGFHARRLAAAQLGR